MPYVYDWVYTRLYIHSYVHSINILTANTLQ